MNYKINAHENDRLTEIIDAYTREILDEIKEMRRELHQNPELSLEESGTQKRILQFLRRHGIEGDGHFRGTSVTALITGNSLGSCVALRADMDALPIQEDTGLPFASQNTGICHACGHDFHMAILAGAAVVLERIKTYLNGQVKLIFQPCEEQAHRGGSWDLIENGILENPRVDAIFSTHVWPDLDIGQIGICRREMMSCCDIINITLYGKGGHISMPHKAVNPIYPAAQLVNALANLRTQRISPFENLIVDLGKFQAGSTNNVIPGKVDLGLNVRAYDNTARYKVKESIEDILEGLSKMYGITFDLDYNMKLPVLNNDGAMGDLFRSCAAGVVGKEHVLIPAPVMSAEDFGGYLEKVPGAFSWLGIGKGTNYRTPLHHPQFMGNEDCLEIGIKLFAQTAYGYLNKE